MQKWTRRYARELTECPPIDVWGAVYFKYEPPANSAAPAAPDPEDDDGDDPWWQPPLPAVTE